MMNSISLLSGAFVMLLGCNLCLADCPTLTPPSNAQASGSGTTSGSTITHSCTSGYTETGGDATRTCQPDDSWSGANIVCTRDCGPLTTPSNAQSSGSGTTSGSSITHSCTSGYTNTGGAATRTCQNDGAWDGTDIVCSPDCASLTTPSNAQASGSGITSGTQITHSCTSGYTKTGGDATRTCQNDGTWSGTDIVCSQDCAALTTPSNAQPSGSGITSGTQITHSCTSGYTKTGGDATRTCQDGTWSGTDIVCSQGSGSDNGSKVIRPNTLLAVVIMLCQACLFG